jgi:hypothetical protein
LVAESRATFQEAAKPNYGDEPSCGRFLEGRRANLQIRPQGGHEDERRTRLPVKGWIRPPFVLIPYGSFQLILNTPESNQLPRRNIPAFLAVNTLCAEQRRASRKVARAQQRPLG